MKREDIIKDKDVISCVSGSRESIEAINFGLYHGGRDNTKTLGHDYRKKLPLTTINEVKVEIMVDERRDEECYGLN